MAIEKDTVETSMEARIARLESDIGHLRSDVTEIKVDLRSLRDRMDGRFDGIDDRIDKLSDALVSTRTWTVTLYIASTAAMLGVMARGFGWI